MIGWIRRRRLGWPRDELERDFERDCFVVGFVLTLVLVGLAMLLEP